MTRIFRYPIASVLLIMLVLPLAGYAQQAVLSVTPKDIKDVPHRLWAKSLTFTDTLTRHPDKGRTIEIRKTTYYRLETKGLGGLAYCSANVIDTLQTLPLNTDYIFSGTVLSRKGKYYAIITDIVQTIDTSSDLDPEIREALAHKEDEITKTLMSQFFASSIQAAQQRLLAYAQKNNIPYSEIFDPRSLHHRKRGDLILSAVMEVQQQENAPSPEAVLSHLVERALFAKLRASEEPDAKATEQAELDVIPSIEETIPPLVARQPEPAQPVPEPETESVAQEPASGPVVDPTAAPEPPVAPQPTATPVPQPTATPVPQPTATPVPKPTATPVPQPTATPVPKPTATPVPQPTATPVPKPTATPVPKPTATPVPKPTATPVPKPTATPVPKPTATPVPTPTPKPTATPVPKPTATPVPTPTPKPTATPVPKPTATPVPKPTATPLPKPTATPTPRPRQSGGYDSEVDFEFKYTPILGDGKGEKRRSAPTPMPTYTPRPRIAFPASADKASPTPLPTIPPPAKKGDSSGGYDPNVDFEFKYIPVPKR